MFTAKLTESSSHGYKGLIQYKKLFKINKKYSQCATESGPMCFL